MGLPSTASPAQPSPEGSPALFRHLALTSGVALATAAVVTAAEPAPEQPTLSQELEELAAGFAESAPAAMQEAFAQGIDEVHQSGVAESAKNVGDDAPTGELLTQDGKKIAADSLWAEGPVVLSFYRGGWCPYCNIQLRAYQENLDQFQALGANLVAISPEKPDNSLETAEKNELEFTVLSDVGNEVADKFGLRYEIDPVLVERFAPILEEYNGEESHTLPLTATYVVDTDGTIKFSYVTADYKLRAEPSDIVSALKHIKMGH